MNALDRLAAACVNVAARRWPADLAGSMRQEWLAELAALREDPGRPWPVRAWRMLRFAVSLACAPAVEPVGASEVTWRHRMLHIGRTALALAGVAGVTLLAAALSNVQRAALHALGPVVTGGDAPAGSDGTGWTDTGLLVGVAVSLALVAVTVTVLAWLGSRTADGSRRLLPRTVAFGVASAAFLLAGNEVAVMPFMGWRDVLPAVASWTVLTVVVLAATRRLVTAGRRAAATLTGVLGGLFAVDVAAICGHLHAAGVLRIDTTSSPAWFPLSLLPGGTVHFGGPPVSAPSAGPVLHASELLIGNASAMLGPLLACTAFLTAQALRGGAVPTPDPLPSAVPIPAPPDRSTGQSLPTGQSVSGRRTRLATAVFLAALAPVALFDAPVAESLPSYLHQVRTGIAGAATAPDRALAARHLLATAILVAAVVAACGARRHRTGRPAQVTAIASAVLAVPALAALAGCAHRAGLHGPVGTPVMPGLAVGAPLAVTVLAFALWDDRQRRARQVAFWAATLLVSVVLAAPLAVGGAGSGADLWHATLLRVARNSAVFGFGFTGTVAGQVAVAALLGMLAPRWPATAPGTAARPYPHRPYPHP